MQITTSYEYGNDEYTEENSVWESTDPTVATVVKGLVTPLKAGAATITLKVGAKPYVALTVTVAANEWIEIGTPEQFNSIHSKGTDGSPLNGNYVLTADLDFAGKEALFSSWEKRPRRALTGVFDGNGYAIKNAKVAQAGSGKVVQNNVHTYADKAALLAEQKVLMDSWDQAFWGFLNAEAVVEA